jgi:hypothetical protein
MWIQNTLQITKSLSGTLVITSSTFTSFMHWNFLSNVNSIIYYFVNQSNVSKEQVNNSKITRQTMIEINQNTVKKQVKRYL